MRNLVRGQVSRTDRRGTAGLRPDLTLLLAIDAEAAASRAGESDRFEDEGAELQRRVRDAYEELERLFRGQRDDEPKKISGEQVLQVYQAYAEKYLKARIEIIPDYHDTTTFRHDAFVGLRGGVVETVIPLLARGKLV